jgi:argininosuccinate lyase
VFGRDFTRVRAAFDGINRSPAGAAAVTGSDFALDRDRTAHLLGFGDVLVNTMDATLSNDAFIECVLAVRVLAANIGRLAEDLLFWTTTEAGMMRVPDRFCDTSSIMAQKRNPSVLHQMRALSLHAGAAMTAALEAEAGQTGQAVLARKAAEDAAWVLLSNTVQRLNEVADLIPSLTLDPERMLALAEGDWSQATDVAGLLVREAGLSWRAAHQIVGILVKNCEGRGVHPTRVTVELVHEAACQYGLASIELSAEGLASAVSARDCVGRRTGIGGPAPDRVRADLDAVRTRLDADRSGVDDYLRQLAEGAAALDDAVTAILE